MPVEVASARWIPYFASTATTATTATSRTTFDEEYEENYLFRRMLKKNGECKKAADPAAKKGECKKGEEETGEKTEEETEEKTEEKTEEETEEKMTWKWGESSDASTQFVLEL
jgi:hypothetical protein